MKILNRYIISNFFGPFVYALLAFTGILILTEWLGMIELLVRMKTPILIVLEYLGLRLPSIFFDIVPSATLLAILFGFNELASRGEIAAMCAAGVSIIRISLPILMIALGISIISFFFTGFIGAKLNARAHQTMGEKIEHVSPKTKMYGISLRGQDNRVYHFGVFDNELGQIRDLTITESKGKNSPVLRIDAQFAQWQKDGWHLFNGVIRRFDEKHERHSLERFEVIRGQIRETPDDIWKILRSKKKRSENMTILELLDYIKLLKVSGAKFRGNLTDFYLKFSRPLVNLIIAIVGISLVFSSGHKGRGKVAGFGIALIVSFLYWGIMAVSRSLGQAGVLPPLLAACMPNILFLGLGVVMWWKIGSFS